MVKGLACDIYHHQASVKKKKKASVSPYLDHSNALLLTELLSKT